MRQTGQFEEIHSPEAWARSVVSRIWPESWSIAVVCTVAISCWPRLLRTISSPLASEAYRKVWSPSRGNGERMVAVRDFSGLVSSPWALARAAAMAPMVSLERCMVRLHLHYLEAYGARFRAFGT